jgi:hypothetical protein
MRQAQAPLRRGLKILGGEQTPRWKKSGAAFFLS